MNPQSDLRYFFLEHISTPSFKRYICRFAWANNISLKKKNLYEIVSSFETFLKETLSTAGQEKSRLTPACTYMDDMQERCFSLLKLDLNIKRKKNKKR